MPLERAHPAPASQSGLDGQTAPREQPPGHAQARDDPAALTILVAADGREKARLLEALAEGRTPEALHASRQARRGDAQPVAAAAAPAPEASVESPNTAADAVLAARLRLAALRAEDVQLREAPDGDAPPDADRILERLNEAAEYRARLLQLAAARAHLATIEQTIAACRQRLAAFEPDAAALRDELGVDPDALVQWQARVVGARAADDAAARAAADAAATARRLSTEVREELARDVFDGAHTVDVRWRRLWHLRRHLEEIWEVQSRAEAEARALAERDAALQAATARLPWVPSPGLQRFSGTAALAATLIAFWSGLWVGRTPALRDAALAGALALLHGGLLLRERLGGRRAQEMLAERERRQADLTELRRRRDRDWARAAQLATAIEAGAGALGLATPVTPDVVDACEQEMAEALRTTGAETPLTRQLVTLLAAEERAERAEAHREVEAAERRAVEREWIAWRDAAGLPAGLDAARISEWLDTRLQLADARAAHAAARAQLALLEPATAAWEADVRALLATSRRAVSPELCGRELTDALAPLARRVRAAREHERRRERLASEIRAAEQALARAEAAAGTSAPPARGTAADDGGSARHATVLETAGAILAHATEGALTGFRAAPSGGVLVVDGRNRGLPITAIPDGAGRRCVQFLLRLGEALLAPQRPLVVDDPLASLADDEAVFVARAIAALARTRPLIYVTSAATRARSLRLLPGPARVLE